MHAIKYIYSWIVEALFRLQRKRFKWKDKLVDGVYHKKYNSYEEYLNHQKEKLSVAKNYWLPIYEREYEEILKKRLLLDGIVKKGKSTLCLAARTGVEVKSFLSLGCFAVGLDLNPGKDNKYVVTGDFHKIQYPNSIVDYVFTNSLDHAFDVSKLVLEIKRVLKNQGIFILQLINGKKEGFTPGYFESICWDYSNKIVEMFENEGFSMLKAVKFNKPWDGTQIYLKLTK